VRRRSNADPLRSIPLPRAPARRAANADERFRFRLDPDQSTQHLAYDKKIAGFQAGKGQFCEA
jgi:hypothetical protein